MEDKYAQIAVALPLKKTFSYRIPEELKCIEIGSIVLVPFGKRKITGYVTDLKKEVDLKGVKNIISVLNPLRAFSHQTLQFLKVVSEYYAASLTEVIKMTIPPGLDRKSDLYVEPAGGLDFHLFPEKEKTFLSALKNMKVIPVKMAQSKFGLNIKDLKKLENEGLIDFSLKITRAKVGVKSQRFIELNPKVIFENHKIRSKKEIFILDYLKKTGGKIPADSLKKLMKSPWTAINCLKQKNLIIETMVEKQRSPYLDENVKKDNPPNLFEDQNSSVETVKRSIISEEHEKYLLYGITGSGKTEVYLRLIEETLKKNKSALALVPEISLTPQFVQRFRARFGNIISVIHSAMSLGERYDQWRKIIKGESKIVIGARSALFSPLDNIGIIVVDEEHDQSYKQEDRIMYNARDLAILRAQASNAVIILGSATPSLESYHRALKGEFKLLKLKSRVTDFGLPDVEIVDLREERGKFGKRSFLSEKLINAISKNSKEGGKTILFLNRRGFSSAVICARCGLAIKCPECSVSMKYHDNTAKLICHYCDYSVNIYGFCNTCGAKSLIRLGFGTEQVEREIKAHFPDLSVERMDRDTTRRKFSHEKIIRRLEAGKIDILIGTQMVSKGLDVKGVNLVGVILADISLNLPDFRACEKTFSLLTQVAGRSGRGKEKGKVIIQTYNPEHYSIKEASKQDFVGFFEKEIIFRKDVKYPPFVRLACVRFSAKDLEVIQANSKRLKTKANIIKNEPDFKGSIEILGPCPSPLERLKGLYRYQMLIKSTDDKLFSKYIKKISTEFENMLKKSKEFSFKLDIDPQSFM